MTFDDPLLVTLLEVCTRANIGVVMFGYRDGKIDKLWGNTPAVAKLGYTLEEWHAVPAFGVISPEQRARVIQMYERIAEGLPPPATSELAMQAKDGTPLRGEIAIGRAFVNGQVVLVIVLRDLGAVAKPEMSLLEADRLSLVGALSAGFAHEINNPLTSVVLNLRSLRKQIANGFTDPMVALRCVDDVTLAAERIASNVRALQTLATRSGAEQVDLAAVVTSALRLAAPTLEPRAKVVRRIVAGVRATGEESRIGQAVLAMLLFSSSGFHEAGGPNSEITVVVEPRGDRVVVEVSDNGRELVDEEAAHAFDPFFRSSARGAAVGVGLAIARSVAIGLGGEVSLARRDGGGAVITMTLAPA